MTIENVLLITIDSLRHDFREVDAPNMMSLAQERISFENAFATGPGTTPSFPGILTGTYPLSYGGLGKLSEERPFLARELSSRNMATAGFHSNPFLSSSFNYDTGFDRFEDYQDSAMDVATRLFPQGIEKSVIPDPVTSVLKKSYQFIRGKPRPYERADKITDDALDWLKEVPDEFFAWVHYMDVHHPCFPPETVFNDFECDEVTHNEISEIYSQALEDPESVTDRDHRILVDSYRASLRHVDTQIERLLSTLRQSDQYEETLIIITSDHGQLFGEQGSYGKPYRLVDPLIRVPLILANCPERVAATDELISLVDIPPLIHEILGIETPTAYDGTKFWEEESRRYVRGEHQVDNNTIVGIRSGDQKYVVDNISDVERAYTIKNGDETAVAVETVSPELQQRTLGRLEEIDVEQPEYVTEIDTTAEQRLEDLGYL